LGLENDGEVRERVKYHKDMWNEKYYNHDGLGNVFKALNGDHLMKITGPDETLKDPER
jgi:hypothetical protein